MDGSGKACHVLLRVNVYEEDDVDVRECDNTNSKRIVFFFKKKKVLTKIKNMAN